MILYSGDDEALPVTSIAKEIPMQTWTCANGWQIQKMWEPSEQKMEWNMQPKKTPLEMCWKIAEKDNFVFDLKGLLDIFKGK